MKIIEEDMFTIDLMKKLEKKRLFSQAKTRRKLTKEIDLKILKDAIEKKSKLFVYLRFKDENDLLSFWNLLGKYKEDINIKNVKTNEISFSTSWLTLLYIFSHKISHFCDFLLIFDEKMNYIIGFSNEPETISLMPQKFLTTQKTPIKTRLTVQIVEKPKKFINAVEQMFKNHYEAWDLLRRSCLKRFVAYEQLIGKGEELRQRWRIKSPEKIYVDHNFEDYFYLILSNNGFAFYPSIFTLSDKFRINGEKVKLRNRFTIEIESASSSLEEYFWIFQYLEKILKRYGIKYFRAFSGSKSPRLEFYFDEALFTLLLLDEIDKNDEVSSLLGLYMDKFENKREFFLSIYKAAIRAIKREIYFQLIRQLNINKKLKKETIISMNPRNPFVLLDFPSSVSISIASPKAIVDIRELKNEKGDKEFLEYCMEEFEIKWPHKKYFTLCYPLPNYFSQNDVGSIKFYSLFPLALYFIKREYPYIKSMFEEEAKKQNAYSLMKLLRDASNFVHLHQILKKYGEYYIIKKFLSKP